MSIAFQLLRILHLEDNPRDAELVREQLTIAGLDCSIVCVATEQQFDAALAHGTWDVILLDFNIPGYAGTAALQSAVQRRPDVPAIVVSGTLGEEAAVECLQRGAVDYVLKQRPARLVAAVRRAVLETGLRRTRRQSEEALRESQAHLRLAQAVARVGSWKVNLESGLAVFSDEYCRILGMAPGTSITFHEFLKSVHADDRKYVDRSWTATIKEGRPYDVTCRILVKDEVRSVHARAELAVDAAGHPVSVIATLQDVTEQERDRNALAASEQFIRATLSALPISIAVLDEDSRILRTNWSWREFGVQNGRSAGYIDEGSSYLDVCDRAAAQGVPEAVIAGDLIRDLIGGRRLVGSFEYACHSPQEERWLSVVPPRFGMTKESMWW